MIRRRAREQKSRDDQPPVRGFWLPDLSAYGDAKAQAEAYKDAALGVCLKYGNTRILARLAYGFLLIVLIPSMIDWNVSRWQIFAIMFAGVVLFELAIRQCNRLLIRIDLTRCLDDTATQCKHCDESLLDSTSPNCPACHREVTQNQRSIISARIRRGLDTNPATPAMLEHWQMADLRNDLVDLLDDQFLQCRNCSYPLMEIKSGRCPECGTAIDDRQRSTIDAREEADAWTPPRPDQAHNPYMVIRHRKKR